MPNIPPQDHAVPHVSTVPANLNEHVELFVREYDGTKPHHDPEPVLMLHGRSVPALAGFDLQHDGYSWAQDLAQAGYDVFVMDLQGSGRSPRPEMDNPCNANPAQQKADLVPNPLAAPCPPAYPKQLGNSQSEWDELNTVVEFVRKLRSVPQVAFVGWSAAAFVMGPYVLQHPGKVSSLMFLAPIYPPRGNASKPGTRFGAPHPLPLTTPAAQFGFPMNLLTKADLTHVWDPELKCAGQRESGMVDVVWAAIMDNDALGKTWGPLNSGVPEGVCRFRNSFWWGWNDATVPLDNTLGTVVPVLLVYGEDDTQAIHPTPDDRTNFSVPALYAAIPGTDKLMIRVACAGHQMVWENRAKDLHHMAREWLKHTAVDGLKSGSYALDTNGNYTPYP
ncbi:alpha/beta fold hydrolase [Kitasatospora sp. NPDC059722]|uniref:alpha/beta fold hydrolase n=1 Tax=unclassified Kitasatospora TaxID=2633591 RepID=UPI00365AE829